MSPCVQQGRKGFLTNLDWQSCPATLPQPNPSQTPPHPHIPKRLQMHSAPICHGWNCDGVSSYVPAIGADGAATARSFNPASGHPTPLLQFYTFCVMDNDAAALFSLRLRRRRLMHQLLTRLRFIYAPARSSRIRSLLSELCKRGFSLLKSEGGWALLHARLAGVFNGKCRGVVPGQQQSSSRETADTVKIIIIIIIISYAFVYRHRWPRAR